MNKPLKVLLAMCFASFSLFAQAGVQFFDTPASFVEVVQATEEGEGESAQNEADSPSGTLNDDSIDEKNGKSLDLDQ